MDEKHTYTYQCEGEDCPLCFLDTEIERLTEEQRAYRILAKELMAEKNAEIERLEAELKQANAALEHISRHWGSAEQCREIALAALETDDECP